ncbi:MAG: hypothetical protein ACPG7F_10500 [Aggregatilineales bacterium]
MKYHLSQDKNDADLYIIEFHKGWTWNDWYPAFADIYKMIAQVDHRVDLVIAFYSLLPAGNAIPHLKYAGEKQPPNTRHTIMVNRAGAILPLMVQNIVGVMDWEGPTWADDIDHAQRILAQKRIDMP